MISTRTPWYYGWTIVAVAMTYLAIIYGIAIYGFTFRVPYWKTDWVLGLLLIPAIVASSGLSGRASVKNLTRQPEVVSTTTDP